MIAEAISRIEALVRGHEPVSLVKAPGDPAHVFYAVRQDGSLERHENDPAPLAVVLDTPEAFVAYVKDHQDANPEVYFTAAGLVLIEDSLTRRDRAECPMPFSPQFSWLREQSRHPMNQSAFVRLLRIDLRGCLSEPSGLLELVRNLKWAVGADTDREIRHGKESLDRRVVANVRGEAAIPEETVLTVPIWKNFGFCYPVQCAVEVMPAEQMFRLTPYPLALEAAVIAGLDAIHRLLSQDGMPAAYMGKP